MDEFIDKLHPQKDTQEYSNGCDHEDGSYLGSIQQGPDKNDEWLDIYIFDGGNLGQQVCIRYGKNDQDYYSPGSITNLIKGQMDAYQLALHVIQKKGEILFIKGE